MFFCYFFCNFPLYASFPLVFVPIYGFNLNIWKYYCLTSLHSLSPGISIAQFLFPIIIIHYLLNCIYSLRAAFCEYIFFCILAMNDVDSLSLGYFLASSPDVTFPDVWGVLLVILPIFPSVNWILTSNLYVVLHFDYSRLVIYIYIYIYIGWIEKIGYSFWFDMEFCCF